MKPWRRVSILALAVMSLTVEMAVAATPTPQTDRAWLRTSASQGQSPTANAGSAYGKWMLALLVLGAGGWMVYKRRRPFAGATAPSVTQLRITAATRLSPKAQIVAIQVQGRTLLVGATDVQITRLGWIDEDDGEALSTEDDDAPDERSPSVAKQGQASNPSLQPRRRGDQRLGGTSVEGSVARGTPSRFRDLLADAIGLPPKRNAVEAKAIRAPVDELIEGAEDRYVGSDVRRTQRQAVRRETPHQAPMINVEGQAQGLVARLNRPQR